MKNVIKAVEISRPLLWLNTSMPLLWGLLATRGALQPSDLVLFAFFLPSSTSSSSSERT